MNKKKLIIVLTTALLFMGLQLLAGQFFPSGRGTGKGTQQSASINGATEHKLQKNHVSHAVSSKRTDHYSSVDDRIKWMRLAAYLSALGNKTSDPRPAWFTDKKDWMKKNRGYGTPAIGLLDLGSARSAGPSSSRPSVYFPTITLGSNNPGAGDLLPGYILPSLTFPSWSSSGPNDNSGSPFFFPGIYPPSWVYTPGGPQGPGSPIFYFPYPGGLTPPKQDDPTQKVVPLPGSALLLVGTLGSFLVLRRKKTIWLRTSLK